MHMETKYLRVFREVALGSRFGDWQVCWLGGWAKHRLYYLVMLVRVASGEGMLKNCRRAEGHGGDGCSYLEDRR